MSHDDHSHGHDGHGAHDGGHGGHGEDARLQAAPNPPPRGAQDSPNRAVPPPTPSHGREALRGGDGILRPISESEYFSATPEAEAIVGSHIDEYFNRYKKAETNYLKAHEIGNSKTTFQKLYNLYLNKLKDKAKATKLKEQFDNK